MSDEASYDEEAQRATAGGEEEIVPPGPVHDDLLEAASVVTAETSSIVQGEEKESEMGSCTSSPSATPSKNPIVSVGASSSSGGGGGASVDDLPIYQRIAIFSHDACAEHDIEGHIERPERVLSILEKLHRDWPEECFREAPRVLDEQILLFHTKQHLATFKTLVSAAEENDTQEHFDSGDTSAMNATREAAYRSAGALIGAIDAVFLPISDPMRARAAFCPVRPPGHHAERHRAMGFCFLANAGIGARYAQKRYGLKKVAVIDFDVHHGNGTEEGFHEDENLFYGSTHQVNHYPGTGPDPTPYIGELARNAKDRRIVNRCLRPGEVSRSDFHEKWRQVVDEMVRFAPELVIISAGFDAHIDDPLSDTELIEEDYVWATKIVMEACVRINKVSPVPCVSILEGGYHLEAITASASVHVKELAKGFPAPPAPGDESAALARMIEEMGINDPPRKAAAATTPSKKTSTTTPKPSSDKKKK